MRLGKSSSGVGHIGLRPISKYFLLHHASVIAYFISSCSISEHIELMPTLFGCQVTDVVETQIKV